MANMLDDNSKVSPDRKRARGGSHSTAADILQINVGGKMFWTSRKTLGFDRESMLGNLFSENSPFGPPAVDANGHVFIDRDGDAFEHVLNYLRRSGNLVGVPSDVALLARIKNEADYFGLSGLARQVKTRLLPDSAVSKGAFDDLVALGLPAATILRAGHTASKLTECGVTASVLKDRGWTPAQCNILGFTAQMCKVAGFSETDMLPFCELMDPLEWRTGQCKSGEHVIAPRGDNGCYSFGIICGINFEMDPMFQFDIRRISSVAIQFQDGKAPEILTVDPSARAVAYLSSRSFLGEEDEPAEEVTDE